MAKSKTKFVCQNCGASHSKWQGQCEQCGEWNTLVEEVIETVSMRGRILKPLSATQISDSVVTRPEIKAAKAPKQRFSTAVEELDRVLGGGIVPGSVMLIGGEPGIGKSTLLTQVCMILLGQLAVDEKKLKKKTQKRGSTEFGSILYVCGEESPEQINLRINRILKNEQFLSNRGFGLVQAEVVAKIDQKLKFVTSTDVDQVVAIINQVKPGLVVVDSIQTLSTQDLSGSSGSIGQVRESTERIIRIAKAKSTPVFLVGHVTKDGSIAGPKVLEHMVDAVLQLEGERIGQFRMLRALKNRFGATDEVGVFKVVDYGFEQVTNPSELFLENSQTNVPGSAITCIMEGTRPLLLEVQALVNQSQLTMPRRVGRGIELSRIQVLAAVLQKHSRLALGNYDIFVNAAGGFKIKEPAVDLALAIAITSSLNNQLVKAKTVFIGEVGLLGEIRPVPYLDRRIKEAKRLGYKEVVSSKSHQRLQQVLKEYRLLK